MFSRLYEKLKKIRSEYSELMTTFFYSSFIGFSVGLAYLSIRRQINYYDESLIIQTKLLQKIQENNNILVSNLLISK
jgi:hypothetical protein